MIVTLTMVIFMILVFRLPAEAARNSGSPRWNRNPTPTPVELGSLLFLLLNLELCWRKRALEWSPTPPDLSESDSFLLSLSVSRHADGDSAQGRPAAGQRHDRPGARRAEARAFSRTRFKIDIANYFPTARLSFGFIRFRFPAPVLRSSLK